jgi:hypothetical protein
MNAAGITSALSSRKYLRYFIFLPPRQGIMQCVTNRFGDTSGTLGYSGAYYLKPHFP